MSLVDIDAGLFAWLATEPGPEAPNAGVVVDEDGLTLVDSLLTPGEAAPLRTEVEALGLPLRRMVLTSSHLDRVGGSSAFPFAAVYGTAQTSALLEQAPNLDVFRHLYSQHASELDDQFTTRRVTHIIDEAVQLTPALAVVPTPGPSLGSLVVVASGADVCFGGAVLSFGVTPLVYDSDPLRWAASLDLVAEMATSFVPGTGPVGTGEDVALQAEYLRACAAGGPVPSGPWDSWTERDRDAVNTERASLVAAGDDSIPQSMLRYLGLA